MYVFMSQYTYKYLQGTVSPYTWTTMQFRVDMTDVMLHCYNNSDVLMCTIDLQRARLTYDSSSDCSNEIDLIAHATTLVDKRYNGRS
jgi:hypothetical protein